MMIEAAEEVGESTGVSAACRALGVPRSSVYRAREPKTSPAPRPTPDRALSPVEKREVRDHVVQVALAHPDKSPRQLAWFITDTEEAFISESSVYRILKRFDLVTSPVFQVASASDRFKDPTQRINDLWQTDFTQFKVVGWGWYYLCTVLDDFSRYILSWKLTTTMATTNVQDTLDMALEKTGVTQV
jgi:transposase InsO family protein